MVFEPRVGGHVYDRGVDGSECRWARVLAFEPPRRLVISWDISLRWEIEHDPDRTSEIEVTFNPRDPSAPGSSSSTATSTATATVGSRCAARSGRPTAGTGGCSASPPGWKRSCRSLREGRSGPPRPSAPAALRALPGSGQCRESARGGAQSALKRYTLVVLGSNPRRT